MTSTDIIKLLPYAPPFLFVDELTEINENQIQGNYTFKADEYFYRGHFKNNPVTPGVILTETMAQIGLVCLGIYIVHCSKIELSGQQFALSSSEIEFRAPVFPGEKVSVLSKKIYFRFNKLKCQVEMKNEDDKVICHGTLSGIILKRT